MLSQLGFVVLAGIKFGALYALTALGLVVVHKATKTVNFAHGAFAMLGAFGSFLIVVNWGWPYWTAYLMIPIAIGAIAATIELLVSRRRTRGTDRRVHRASDRGVSRSFNRNHHGGICRRRDRGIRQSARRGSRRSPARRGREPVSGLWVERHEELHQLPAALPGAHVASGRVVSGKVRPQCLSGGSAGGRI